MDTSTIFVPPVCIFLRLYSEISEPSFQLIIWTEGNVVPVGDKASKTLDEFSTYVSNTFFGEMKMKFDHAHLVIYKNWGSLAGKY